MGKLHSTLVWYCSRLSPALFLGKSHSTLVWYCPFWGLSRVWYCLLWGLSPHGYINMLLSALFFDKSHSILVWYCSELRLTKPCFIFGKVSLHINMILSLETKLCIILSALETKPCMIFLDLETKSCMILSALGTKPLWLPLCGKASHSLCLLWAWGFPKNKVVRA